MSAIDTPRFNDDSFDVQASLRRLRQTVLGHIPMIVVTVLATLALVLLYLRLFPPIYHAEVLVAAEAQEDSSRTSYYAAWDVFRKGDIKSEPTLMTSRTVAQRVVEELDLKFDDVHHSVLMHIGYLWSDSWLGRRYRQFKEWLFPPDTGEYQASDAEIDRARTIEAYRLSMVLEPVGTSNIGRLVVRAPSHRAAQFANKTIEVYLLQRRQVSSQEAETAYQSLKAELERVSVALTEAEVEKLSFDRRNGLSVEFERDKVLLGKWGELRTTIADLQAQIGSATAGLAVIERNLASEPPEVVSGRTLQESRVRTLMQQREFELSTTLQGMAERYRSDAPEMLEAQRLLAEARAALAREPERSELAQTKVLNPTHETLRSQKLQLATTLASNRAMLDLRKADYAALTARLDTLPQLFREAQSLARKREALEGRYRLLNERFMMADVSRSAATRSPSSLRVVDYASPPMKKTWPDLKILLPAAVVVGLLFGVALALLAEMFSAKVTRGRLAARRDLPLYAVVGATAPTPARPQRGLPDGSEPAFPRSALARLRLPTTGQRSFEYFSARMNESAARRLQLENDLYRAVERDELLLYFHQRYSIATGQPSGCEALLRWKHPQRGLVPAAEFITLAEDTGMIVPIGEWALRAAARQVSLWAAQGRKPMPLAVNLSATQFRQHDLVARVQAILVETGIAPELLEVEITEATLMQQTDQTLATLDALNGLGARLSIDDVGARHSGLAYLQRFPVNQIKIDKSFVRDMLSDNEDAAVVRSIIAFAHDLQLRVVAEGVETQAQLDFLRQSGCEEAQGFFFGHPVPADQLNGGPGAAPRPSPSQDVRA